MKLIEILVKKHYEEGWEWPDKAHECHRHAEDSVCAYFYTESGGAVFGAKTIPVEGVEYLGVGDDGESVTRSGYEAALAASKEMLVNKPVAWDGQGLPPVGAECEIKRLADWMPVTIKFISERHTIFTTLGGTEDCYQTCSLQFRPIRTEAERKRSDICDKIYGAMTNAERKDNRSDMAEAVYDAIAAGKIPGVKLEAPDA